MLRKRVLLNAVIADEDGENAVACSILDTSTYGAKVQLSDWTLQRDSQIFLIDTSNERAHLATVVWTDADRAGLSFVRSYALEAALPPRFEFLKRHLVEAKLRQVQALVSSGAAAEEAARAVGLSEEYLKRFGMSGIFEEKVALLLHQAKRLFSK
ncbi:MAG: PilZ domain-containing protein [Longimicrobiales bacterium]